MTRRTLAALRAPRRIRAAFLAALLAGLTACAAGDPVGTEEPPPGGNPPGGDTGGTGGRIDTVFSETFESGSLSRWDDGVDPARHRIVTDAAFARQGSRYLEITHPQGSDGGYLNKFFLPGYDSLYVRYYVRLEPTWRSRTKLIGLYGSRVDNQWSSLGRAGICPTGTDFFNAMIVTESFGGDPGQLHFYTYHPDMGREPDGTTCWGDAGDGTEQYFGDRNISRGAWHKVELWLRVNRVGQRDAAQKFWVDDVLKGEWNGFRVRTTTDLRINILQLSFNICCGGAPATQRVWVDDVLVATRRP